MARLMAPGEKAGPLRDAMVNISKHGKDAIPELERHVESFMGKAEPSTVFNALAASEEFMSIMNKQGDLEVLMRRLRDAVGKSKEAMKDLDMLWLVIRNISIYTVAMEKKVKADRQRSLNLVAMYVWFFNRVLNEDAPGTNYNNRSHPSTVISCSDAASRPCMPSTVL